MSRPICVHCGEKYGSRWTTDEIVRRERVTDPFPRYRGNLVVVKELTVSDTALVSYRTLWDGVSWSKPYEPFCKLRCALDYARKAYARGKQPKLRAVNG